MAQLVLKNILAGSGNVLAGGDNTGNVTKVTIGANLTLSGGVLSASGGGTGSVTSVALTRSGNALTITGSPITTAGTINIGFAGTTAQYIRGDGTLATFPTITGYVPYTGATQNLDLGTYGLLADFVGFNTAPTSIPTTQGTLSWNVDKESLDLIMNGTTGSLMQDSFYNVKNQTGVTIPKGTVVRANGTVGASGRILIAPFLADGTYSSKYCMGVTAEAIADGADGKVLAFGALRKIDTSAYTNGTILYASPTTAGAFTTTEPSNPNNIVTLAIVVYSDNTNGEIFVRPTFVPSQAELILSLGYTPANDANVVKLTGNQTVGGVKTFSAESIFSNGITLTGGDLVLKSGTYTNTINTDTLIANRSILFPDNSGTVALTSDIVYPVTSVFGRTGDVVAVDGDYNTDLVTEGSTNLYYTNTRARLAFSANPGSALTYNNATGRYTLVAAESGIDGYLTGDDWDYFDSKQANLGTGTTSQFLRGDLVWAAPAPISLDEISDVDYVGTPSTGQLLRYRIDHWENWTPTYVAAGFFSATAPLSYNSGTGVFSISLANSTTNGYLSSTDWNTFNNKQSALTNPVTGTGTTNYLPKFTGTSTIGNSAISDNGATLSFGLAATFSSSVTANAASQINGLSQDALQTIFTLQGTNASAQTKALYFRLTAGTPLWSINTGAAGLDAAIDIKPDANNGLRIPFGSSASSFTNGLTIGGDLQLLGVNPRIDYPNGSYFRIYEAGIGTRFNIEATSGITTIGDGASTKKIEFYPLAGSPRISVEGGASSNTQGIGAQIRIFDNTNNRGWNTQMDASYNYSLFYYNGTAWSRAIYITGTGSATYGGTIEADTFTALNYVNAYNRFRLYYKDIGTLAAELYEDGTSTNGGTLTLFGKASGTVDTVISAAPTKLNYINNAANVMIGWSTDQGYKLAVNGAGYFSGSITTVSDVIISGNIYTTKLTSATGIEYQVRNANGPSGNHVFKSYNTAILTLDGGTNNSTFGGSVTVGINEALNNSAYNLSVLRGGTAASPGTYNIIPAILIQDYAGDGPATQDLAGGLLRINASRIGDGDANAANATLMAVNNDTGSALHINGKRQVGINTTSPSYTLDVNGTSRVTGAATFSSSISATSATFSDLVTTTSVYRIVQASASRGGLYTYNQVVGSGTDYSLGIASEGEAFITTGGTATKRLVVTSGGNVQIGYSGTPAYAGKLFISRSDQYGMTLDAASGYGRITTTDDFLYLRAGGTDRLTISSSLGYVATSDNFGVRRTPSYALDVNGGTNGINLETNITAANAVTPYFTILETGVSRTVTGYSYGTSQPLAMAITQTAGTTFGLYRASEDTVGSTLRGMKSRGTAAAPASVANGDDVFSVEGWAWHGAGPNLPKLGAGMKFVKDDNWGTANTYAPQRTEFYNANSGTTVITTMIIYPSGNITVTGSVTATGFFESSDKRLKEELINNPSSVNIENVKPKLYIKNGKEELGYYAQDLENILPSSVTKGEDGYLNLSYTQVHTAKIAYLENKIEQLEELIKTLIK